MIYDISTLARAGGQAVGIVRVSRELAQWAHSHRRDVVFAVMDTEIDAFRPVRPELVSSILDGTVMVDMSMLPVAHRGSRREQRSLPRWLRNVQSWLQHPRRRALVSIEGMRLAGVPLLSRFGEWLSTQLMSARYRRELTDPRGRRRAIVRYSRAVAAPMDIGADDALLFTGSEWDGVNFETLRRLKKQNSVAIVVLTYDTIPLLFPQFYRQTNAESFRRFFDNMIPMADTLIVTARQIEKDAANHCRALGMRFPPCRVVALGADPVSVDASSAPRLPDGLEEGRYALFVSTIEPRKNHALLFDVWKRLCAAGVPQAHGFKLVLVGRRGWLVDDLYAELQAFAREGHGLVMLSNVNDKELGDLYRCAAFGVYPSLYEGYGLPLVEMFHFGKTVLSSNGGALAEIAGEFAPCLDPTDPDIWFSTLKRWIESPDARVLYENIIRERFRHPTWREASQQFFDVIDRELNSEIKPS